MGWDAGARGLRGGSCGCGVGFVGAMVSKVFGLRERDIEAYLKRRVKEAGGEARKVAWIGRRHAPDRFIMLPGMTLLAPKTERSYWKPARNFWVELKAPGRMPSVGQKAEHARMRRLGAEVYVIDSFEGVDALFR